MSNKIARNLVLGASLLSLFSTAALASSSQAPAAGSVVSAQGPTGTDPEPTEPNLVDIVLSLLHIA